MKRRTHSGIGLHGELPTYGCDLDRRPKSYWRVPASIYANVKGTWRRKQIAGASPVGPGGPPPSELFADSIGEDLVETLGWIHPSLMGGEDLPDYRKREVEIARIDHASVLGDVISIRARRSRDGEIRYRVVDDIDLPTYELESDLSSLPLTLRELIELIETTKIFDGDSLLRLCYELSNGGFEARGLVVPTWREQFIRGADAKKAVAFCQVSSAFYPELEQWYGRHADGWIADRQKDWTEDCEDCAEGCDCAANYENRSEDWELREEMKRGGRRCNVHSSGQQAAVPALQPDPVVEFVDRAEWTRSKTLEKLASVSDYYRRQEIVDYVRAYLAAHDCFPKGEHLVRRLTVTFPTDADDVVPAQKAGVGDCHTT